VHCAHSQFSVLCLEVQLFSVDNLCITLHEKTIYSGLSKSNIKDHYGVIVITQCLDKIAKINEFSASDEML